MKLDLGCGTHKQEGFIGFDILPLEGVDRVVDLTKTWPIDDQTVDEVYSSHFLEHLTAPQRCHFFNEIHRVLKDTGKAVIITPHWKSSRAYGDPTHKWPPVTEFFWTYLGREWRMEQAPHTDIKNLPWGYNCDLAVAQMFATSYYHEAVFDLCTVVKKVMQSDSQLPG